MSDAIVELEVIPIVTPAVNADDCDGAADTVAVRLTDEARRTGIGEADAPADLVRALIEQPDLHLWSRNVRNLVVGRDPFPIAALVDELYGATLYPGRRGLGIHALSAVDIVLHDIVGERLERPVHELVHPEPEVRDGRMELPAGPGLGIELDEDAVSRYRVDELVTARA